MTAYERKIMDAYEAVSKKNNGKGASAAEVAEHMSNSGTISELDSVIDITDCMIAMRVRGYFG